MEFLALLEVASIGRCAALAPKLLEVLGMVQLCNCCCCCCCFVQVLLRDVQLAMGRAGLHSVGLSCCPNQVAMTAFCCAVCNLKLQARGAGGSALAELSCATAVFVEATANLKTFAQQAAQAGFPAGRPKFLRRTAWLTSVLEGLGCAFVEAALVRAARAFAPRRCQLDAAAYCLELAALVAPTMLPVEATLEAWAEKATSLEEVAA
jgi:hypothetical protein